MTAEKLTQLRESIINFATVIMFTRRRWRILTGSRFLGMTYNNGTKEPITVSVSFSSNSIRTETLTVIVGNVEIKAISVNKYFIQAISFEVGPGVSYRITNANHVNVEIWSEFRT